MPVIAHKSDFNLQAAEELIKKNLYAPSVHCSYYGCFQKMKSILSQCLRIPYEKILVNIKSSRFRISEHSYVREQIVADLYEKRIDAYAIRNLDKDVKRLYNFRIESDYSNKDIFIDAANQAMSISKDVNKLLKNTYNV
jgi:uncharacterized protein (UPF0332 family)